MAVEVQTITNNPVGEYGTTLRHWCCIDVMQSSYLVEQLYWSTLSESLQVYHKYVTRSLQSDLYWDKVMKYSSGHFHLPAKKLFQIPMECARPYAVKPVFNIVTTVVSLRIVIIYEDITSASLLSLGSLPPC